MRSSPPSVSLPGARELRERAAARPRNAGGGVDRRTFDRRPSARRGQPRAWAAGDLLLKLWRASRLRPIAESRDIAVQFGRPGRTGIGVSALGVPQSAVSRTETDLIGAVRSGDDRAFGELYSRYGSSVLGYIAGIVRDRGRAEDISQDVFVSALRAMRASDRAISFKPWIYEIARNACIDEFRRAKRCPRSQWTPRVASTAVNWRPRRPPRGLPGTPPAARRPARRLQWSL